MVKALSQRVNIVDPKDMKIISGELAVGEGKVSISPLPDVPPSGDLYVSPPWIDAHCHIYHGMTSFGLRPDDIGYRQGVHLLVDAGSSGEETWAGFRDYVMPRYRTKVRAFLNISSIGLVTMQECFDMRKLDPEKTAACIMANRELLLGVKVRSSDVILEGKGTAPLRRAVEAARSAGCPIMIHMGENPPSNEENLELLRGGDILSHCFHGKNVPLWLPGGVPSPALKEAMDRGVVLDVAHGAASCHRDTATAAIANGFRDFIISTDLHGRSVHGPVYSLSHTMSKFLAFGMELCEVIRAVTLKPAQALNLREWCGPLDRDCTIFRLRGRTEADFPFVDAMKNPIHVEKVIDPVSVVMDGEMIQLKEDG